MSEARIFAQQTNVGRTSEGNWIGLRGTRDGSMYSAPWHLALALEGKCFAITTGEETTPIVGNDYAGTPDVAKPEILVTVPNLSVVMPLSIYVAVEATVAAAAIIDIRACASAVYDNAVTASSLTIHNVRTDNPFASRCTAYGKLTNNGTTPYTGNSYDFWNPRAGAVIDSATAAAGGEGGFAWNWSAKRSGVAPIIVGEGSLNVYAQALTDIMTTFMGAMWAELPENAIS
jgi:hypothetical protein